MFRDFVKKTSLFIINLNGLKGYCTMPQFQLADLFMGLRHPPMKIGGVHSPMYYFKFFENVPGFRRP